MSILVSLCENGVNPEALSVVVKELKKESLALNVLFLANLLVKLKYKLNTLIFYIDINWINIYIKLTIYENLSKFTSKYI